MAPTYLVTVFRQPFSVKTRSTTVLSRSLLLLSWLCPHRGQSVLGDTCTTLVAFGGVAQYPGCPGCPPARLGSRSRVGGSSRRRLILVCAYSACADRRIVSNSRCNPRPASVAYCLGRVLESTLGSSAPNSRRRVSSSANARSAWQSASLYASSSALATSSRVSSQRWRHTTASTPDTSGMGQATPSHRPMSFNRFDRTGK